MANNEELAFDDVAIEVSEDTYQESIPAGTYIARLVGFKAEVKKPDWKLKGTEGEDLYQYEWTLEITEGEFAGIRLRDFTNRSWHEKATAAKHAAALLNVPALTPGVAVSTGALAGKTCQMWVVEKESTRTPGQFRNYIDKLLPLPAPRQRPQRPQAPSTATQKPAVAVRSVAGLGESMYDPTDSEDDVAF